MSELFDVVGVGCCAADTLCLYSGDIVIDTKMQVHDLVQQGGGLVATGLVAAARQGGKVRFMGRVGDDASSEFIRAEFKKEGVDVSALRTEPGMSAITSFVITNPDTGLRTIFYSLDRVPVLAREDIVRDEALSGKVLYCDGFQVQGSIQAAIYAREAGRPVVMDAELTDPENDELMDLSTHVVASHEFAMSRVGDLPPEESAKALYEKLAPKDPDKVVGVTCGDCGSYFFSKDGELHQPAFEVEVVDTTGCGDVFHGAFAYGLSQEWDLLRIVKFASAVAAIKTRRLGGRDGIPTRQETDAFLRERG